MHALTIDRAALRYRLPESRPDLQGRLDRVRTRLFEHALEAALSDEGVTGSELVCIRTLRVAMRVPEQIADAALLERWASELRHALVERIRDADPRELVRYGSPIAALTDMARSLVRDDRRRAWAWHSLGLIRTSELGSTDAGLQALVRALLDQPTRIVAVVAALATTPTPALRWLRTLPRARRLALLDAALAGHDVDADTRGQLRTALAEFAALEHEPVRAPEPAQDDAALADPALDTRAAASPAFFDFELLPAQPRATSRPPIAALVEALLHERGSLDEHDPDSRELIGLLALLATLETGSLSARARFARALASTRSPLAALVRDIGVAWVVRRTAARRGPSRRDRSSASQHEPERADAAPQSHVDRARTHAPSPADTTTAESPARARSQPREPHVAWRDEPLDARVRAATEWGGLLLVLAIFRSERVWDRLAELAERDGLAVQGLLHAFGRSLIPEPLAADDPALLAFVGLLPGAHFEALDPEPLRERLAALRSSVIAALERRVPVREHRPARGEALLSWLVRRHAEVVGQPGWLELHFRVRDVDTDIRRAGLDLDPGWLPELGLVVKFVYV